MIQHYFNSYIQDLKATLDEIDHAAFEKVVHILLKARQQDKQIFIIGNGGSASTASHFACDLAKGTVDYDNISFKRFRAISLADNMAYITALGNDIDFDEIFTEQLKSYLNPGDVVLGISASGNSPNIVKALRYAKSAGATTIGLLGFNGGRAKDIVDVHLTVSSRNYGIAEDFHLIVQHVMTQVIRRMLHSEQQKVIFLDRDGVINRKAPDNEYITSWKDFEFMPGAMNAMRYFNEMGYKLVVVTNQQGIGKGLMSETTLLEIHSKMQQVLLNNGIHIEKIFYCPHLEETDCACRKPKPGLIYRAQNELNFNVQLENAFFIGDSASDVAAGNRAGCQTILLGENTALQNGYAPTHQVRTLGEVVDILRKHDLANSETTQIEAQPSKDEISRIVPQSISSAG
ncbi:MAG: HAD-IIIA family hydrolase [Deferribacteres bacterium]|nr:HAD-IIIA family hydrolase [candidate division KSB1 bacterium]MCB9508726.1 HAD-IIIA family hydrolase [Deferribacteres bacterium]